MEHDWRKHAIVNGVVMACRKCGDVKRDRNRPCPGDGDFPEEPVSKSVPKSNGLDGVQVDFQI